MLSVTNKPFTLSVVMLSVVMPRVVAPDKMTEAVPRFIARIKINRGVFSISTQPIFFLIWFDFCGKYYF
jgi:hypothetical protein